MSAPPSSSIFDRQQPSSRHHQRGQAALGVGVGRRAVVCPLVGIDGGGADPSGITTLDAARIRAALSSSAIRPVLLGGRLAPSSPEAIPSFDAGACHRADAVGTSHARPASAPSRCPRETACSRPRRRRAAERSARLPFSAATDRRRPQARAARSRGLDQRIGRGHIVPVRRQRSAVLPVERRVDVGTACDRRRW